MESVVAHVIEVIELNEANRIVFYSPALAGQIPTSFAANAFHQFSEALYRYEIVRLCALWDGFDLQKRNLPTVAALVNDTAIIDELVEETRRHWITTGTHVMNTSEDRIEREAVRQAVEASERDFADEQGAKARRDLLQTIARTEETFKSPLHAAIANTRDKHLAHALVTTRRERSGVIPRMLPGHEGALLQTTMEIAERFFCWINGKSFSFENSRSIARKNAEALWWGCRFQVLR
ncbi:MAG TPA: hypothetical protein VF913_06140 [Xanthobacteraceae bacterium]